MEVYFFTWHIILNEKKFIRLIAKEQKKIAKIEKN